MTNKKIDPLRRSEFGNAEHCFQRFDAIVPAQIKREELEDPQLWVNVASMMNPGDEVRARADDDSFVALLHVTYSVGNKVRLKMVYQVELESVDYDEMHKSTTDYEIKQRGPKKWCIVQMSTGEVIKELIPTQQEAMRELNDLLVALGR